jgi:DNA primase catalytic subunit
MEITILRRLAKERRRKIADYLKGYGIEEGIFFKDK